MLSQTWESLKAKEASEEKKDAKQICFLRIPDFSLVNYSVGHNFKHTFCMFVKCIFAEET